MKPAHQTDEE